MGMSLFQKQNTGRFTGKAKKCQLNIVKNSKKKKKKNISSEKLDFLKNFNNIG